MRRGDFHTDPAASDAPPGRARALMGVVLAAGLAVVAFLVSLAATFPVSVAAGYVSPPVEINGYSGTVWNGAVELRGSHSLRWRVDPFASLAGVGLALNVGLRGPGTDLAGLVTLRGFSGRDMRLDGLSGPAGWPLVAALAPELEIACDAAAVAQDVELAVSSGQRSASGSLRSGSGSCVRTDRAMEPTPVPALDARLETVPTGVRAVLTAAADPGTPLAEAEVTNDDVLRVTVHPAGAALVPGMPASGETSLEFPLDLPG